MRRLVLVVIQTLLFVGAMTSTFNIQSARALEWQGVIWIRPDGSIDSGLGVIQRDGDIYTLTANISTDASPVIAIERGSIVIDGNGYTIEMREGNYTMGYGLILMHVNNVTIRNISIKGYCYAACLFRSSSNNKVYRNNFLSPWLQISGFSNNTWDNGYEGNYWSNYNGSDLNGDGIGDLPYIIDENNQDNYPLINPYWIGDVNHDLIIDIFDVTLVASAYASNPLSPSWNPYCDIAGPYGIIDIYNVVAVCRNYGESW